MNVVLHEPEIPFNTGNIGRTCAATGTSLHLIRPLGFSTDDKAVKRAGMDYWHQLDIKYYDNFEDFMLKNDHPVVYMCTTKAKNCYAGIRYRPKDYLMFGKESAGIPEQILRSFYHTTIRIPMLDQIRSLNLANAVSIILYEALRQQGFNGLELAGGLEL